MKSFFLIKNETQVISLMKKTSSVNFIQYLLLSNYVISILNFERQHNCQVVVVLAAIVKSYQP